MSTMAAKTGLRRELAAIVGEAFVCDDPAPLTGYAIDGVRPRSWVLPGTPEEVAAVVRLASQQTWSLVVAGGFTEQGVGNAPQEIDVLLRTDRLTRVLHYDPGDLTIGMEAGARVAEIRNTVAKDGLMLPMDVAQADKATIGGVLATASAGPMQHTFGRPREYCLGVSFVTGDGQIAKAGGRVVKNVAGYDVMKLMIGSYGTLGVIVSANFKLFPATKTTRTFLALFDNLRMADSFAREVRNSVLTPLSMELISPLSARHLDLRPEGFWLAVRAAGSEVVLARYRRELGSMFSLEFTGEEEARLWSAIENFEPTIYKQHQNAMSIRASVTPASVADFIAAAEKIGIEQNMLFSCVGRVGIGSLVGAFVPIAVDPPSVTQYAGVVEAMKKALPSGAAFCVTRCPREAKQYFSIWGDSTSDRDAMLRVKKTLDPNGVLSRGRFLF